ncbi:dihydrolipoyllysine-residue succinyltransferase [Candidatus Portiera aleyrodidarum]|uniref:dihydrolipoyllysine-residue succinyltransferase n=1 Tax=Candidatus Portiera aleyrodidarum TaxID=91844 RepID=UPI001C611D20|nr:dihydrolipoyllysine-residue succinyltransferase [Candidatus Portiera aleyrodidarum]
MKRIIKIKYIDIKAPSFPESVNEGTVATWHKKPGDKISRYEIIVEVETDKVLLEVVSPAEGILKDIKIPVGKTCKSEQLLGIIVDNKEDISPSARKMMANNSIDVKAIIGTGKGGRILKEDVQRSLKEDVQRSLKEDVQRSLKEDVQRSLKEVGEKRVPMSRLRQTMAKRIVKAQKNAALLTTYNEVDMSNIIEIRVQYRELFKEIHGTKLGLMGFFVKACTVALKRFNKVNAFIDAKEIVYHNYQDIGIAVSTNRGLVVPILRNTDSMEIVDIEKLIMDFRQRGINGKLSIKEITGGTFTISNGGVFGSLFSTPIINPPQTAILGMHKIQKRPVVLNGEIVIRPMMYLALSYDHRILDGKDAVQFLNLVKELLENPIRFILNI